jgi:ABC-type dipeptide/oligopeptide/nickel transport system permease component
MGVAIWAGVAYGIGNLLADIVLIFVDPREISK